MKLKTLNIVAIAALAAGCASSGDTPARPSGNGVTKAQAVKAFTDAVLGHCLPAIHTEQEFREFEVDGVTPLARLGDNRISLFADTALPVYQMGDGVVQIQLDAFSSCQTRSNDLPVKATFDLIGNALMQTEYRYTEQDSGYPQDGDELSRVFVSGESPDTIIVALSGTKAGAASSDTP